MPKGIIQIDPHEVVISDMPSEKDIMHQLGRLTEEGQIEPIALKPDNTPDLDQWAYADAQVVAAQRVQWPTILVTYHY